MLGDMGQRFLFILVASCLLLPALPPALAEKLHYGPGVFRGHGAPTRYYAPNNKTVEWQGNKATIVIFNFGKVRQGEVWLSKEGVSGKSVLSCPHDGYSLASRLHSAMKTADILSKKFKGQNPEPRAKGSVPMGEHIAEFYAELQGDTPLIRIDFGPQNSTERHTYRFNLQAGYQLIKLLGIMCNSLHGPGHKKHSASIRHLLKDFAKYNPHSEGKKNKQPATSKEKGPWLN